MTGIEAEIEKLSACRDDLNCKHEKECFELLKWWRSILGSRIEKAETVEDDPDTVADYAPMWRK
jgi:hypothetical protein